MAAASLLIRLGVDLGNLKSGADAAVRELDKLKASATSLAGGLVNAFPKTIGTEAKNIAGAVGTLAGAFGGLGAVVAGLGLGAIADDFLDTTGKLSDLSSQTDISIKDLQRFQFAGDQVGVSLESITSAVGKFQDRLGSLDKSAIAAIGTLGLSLADIQKLNVGQQFESIAVALNNVADANQRAALANDIFGRGGIELMRLFRSSLKDVGDQAFILSDQTVKAGDRFGDLLGRVTNFGKAVLGEALLAPIVRWADETQAAIDDVGRSFDTLRGKAEELPKVLAKPLTGKGFEGPKLSFEEAIKLSDELDRKLETQFKQRAERERRGAEERRRIEEENARLAADAVVQAYEETRIALQNYYDLLLLVNQGIKVGLDDLTFRKNTEVDILDGLTGQWLEYLDVVQSVNSQIRLGLDSAPGEQFSAEMLGLKGPKASSTLADAQNFGRGLAQAIFGAIQGGGNVVGTVGAFIGKSLGESILGTTGKGGLGDFLTKNLGKTIGGALGGAIPIIGTIGGQLLGGVIDKMFGSAGRDMVKQFASSMGGFDALQKKLADTFDPETAHRFWTSLTQGVGRNNPTQAKAIIDEITAAFEKQKNIIDTVPTSYSDVTAAAERYGIEVNKLGDAVNQLRVTETAQQAVKDWELLAKAGANLEEVAAGMADEMQALVIESLKWGHTLPDSMRPIIEKMRDMGLLTDDAGDKLVDLERLNWAKPLGESIDGLIDKMDQLIDRISTGLGGALSNVPSLNLGGSGGGGGSAPSNVIPFPSQSSGDSTVNLYLDGRQIAEATVPHIPDVVRRMA